MGAGSPAARQDSMCQLNSAWECTTCRYSSDFFEVGHVYPMWCETSIEFEEHRGLPLHARKDRTDDPLPTVAELLAPSSSRSYVFRQHGKYAVYLCRASIVSTYNVTHDVAHIKVLH